MVLFGEAHTQREFGTQVVPIDMKTKVGLSIKH